MLHVGAVNKVPRNLRQLLWGEFARYFAEADLERVRELLGEDAAKSLEQMAQLTKKLKDAGLIDQIEGKLELTPSGLRKIGANALRDVFGSLEKDRLGQHQVERLGVGHERTYDTKPYEYGDPFQLDLQQTLRNALQRVTQCCLRATITLAQHQILPQDFVIAPQESVF